MKGLLAVLRREIFENRLVIAAGGVAGLLVLAAPLHATGPHWRQGQGKRGIFPAHLCAIAGHPYRSLRSRDGTSSSGAPLLLSRALSASDRADDRRARRLGRTVLVFFFPRSYRAELS